MATSCEVQGPSFRPGDFVTFRTVDTLRPPSPPAGSRPHCAGSGSLPISNRCRKLSRSKVGKSCVTPGPQCGPVGTRAERSRERGSADGGAFVVHIGGFRVHLSYKPRGLLTGPRPSAPTLPGPLALLPSRRLRYPGGRQSPLTRLPSPASLPLNPGPPWTFLRHFRDTLILFVGVSWRL